MLSVGAMGAGQGNYYLQLAREDYYHAGGEPPGGWWGRGAEALGLAGQVERDALRALLQGYHPLGKPLIQNAGEPDHQPGWDLTLSAPKAVSVLWSQAPEPLRETLQDLHHTAVGAALQYLEDEAALTRRGRGGHRLERTGLVVATFEHGTSRALDPQLHTHALVLNVGTRLDGTTGTILSKPFYEHKMAAGALYRAELGRQLQQELGLTLTPDGYAFGIAGVPEQLVDEFSKRRTEIEAHLSERGTAGARASEVAALQTREVKENVPRAELFQQWREVGRELGFGPEAAQALVAEKDRSRAIEQSREQEATQVLHKALEQLTEHESTFHRRDLLQVLGESLQTRGWGARELRSWLDRAVPETPEVVPLGSTRGEPCYTTREMLELEKGLLHQADDSRSDRSHALPERTVQPTLRNHPDLSPEQRAALEQITQAPGSIQLVSGMAGTGKTQMLEAAREAWERAEFKVYGAAITGKAARGLQDGAGVQSHTLYRWLEDLGAGFTDALQHHGKQLLRAAVGKSTYDYAPLSLDERTILVLDEAGMVGTRPLATLMDHVQKAGAKLILVGDERQLQPIQAGGPFRALGELLGGSRLTEIQRQRDEWARQAVHDFAEGRAAEGLRAYAERGLLTVGDTRHEAKDWLVRDWTAERQVSVPERLILTTTNEEARELNARIQDERKAAGELGPTWLSVPRADRKGAEGKILPNLTPLWLQEEGERFYLGDRILFNKNSRLLGVQNGTLGTVQGINLLDRALTVELDSGDLRTIPLNRYQDVSLGYALTTHKAQGATAEQVYLLAGGSFQDRELTYVQASRARGETRLYTERSEVGDTLTQLARQMQTSHRKELALEFAPNSPVSTWDLPERRVQERRPEPEPERAMDHELDWGY